ncbi:MAG: alpha/beta fold hydrolase [Ilumatobacteraceae bacterium]
MPISEDPATRRPALAAFAALNAAAAWAGVVGLTLGGIEFGDTLDARLPFESLVLAAVGLALIVAVPMTLLAWWAWTGNPRTLTLAFLVGIAVIGWIALQVIVLRAVSLFQPVYLAVGVWFIAESERVHLRPTTRGALVASAGALAVAVGVGLVPQFVENLPSAGALLCAVGILGGGAAVVAGARMMLHGRPVGTRVAGTVATLLGVVVATWLIAPGVAATNVPPSVITATPGDLGVEFESVTMSTVDGVELAGWYLTGTSDAAIVVAHGAGSTRSDALEQAAVLSRNGFGVLLVDARGHGDSDGTAMDFGWYGDADLIAAIDHLAERTDVDPDRIGLLGLSMGGEETIGVAAADTRVRAVVAEGATARTAQDKAWLSDAYGWRGWLQEQVEKVQFGITDLLTDASPPTTLRSAVGDAVGTPFLLITASAVADEGDAAEYLRTAAPERVTVWTVEGASHTGGLDTSPVEWEERVVSFLDEHLRSS